MKYIELFAGCGGLSLGLESIKYDLLFANELSPMASETFAYNLLGEDLKALGIEKKKSKKVKWITSSYGQKELEKRLAEDPRQFPAYHPSSSDLALDTCLSDLKGKLLVGSIIELNKYLESNTNLADQIRTENVDLVSGGPPCQSFSLAGLRQADNHRNTLPMDFAEFVSHVQPKVALLENVSGILRAFSLPEGKRYAWFEVARAFAKKLYYPLCLHVNAKYARAAQNRPRFIMIAMRHDVFEAVMSAVGDGLLGDALKSVKSFYDEENKKENKWAKQSKLKPFVDFRPYDIEKDPEIFSHDLLKDLYKFRESKSWHTVEEAISDLAPKVKTKVNKRYLDLLKDSFEKRKSHSVSHKPGSNSEHRGNSPRVKMRFLLYQYLSKARKEQNSNQVEREVVAYLKAPASKKLSKDVADYLMKKKYLEDDGESLTKKFEDQIIFENYLSGLSTKKQTQRALVADRPAPAALSIPDDACHYQEGLHRTLSVREMARFQSFPDWFEFRSKVTTGGIERRFQVPQYTQVGNAVPPLLGVALGKVVSKILQCEKKDKVRG